MLFGLTAPVEGEVYIVGYNIRGSRIGWAPEGEGITSTTAWKTHVDNGSHCWKIMFTRERVSLLLRSRGLTLTLSAVTIFCTLSGLLWFEISTHLCDLGPTYCSSKIVSYTLQILSNTNCTNIGFNVLPKLAAFFLPITLLLFGSR